MTDSWPTVGGAIGNRPARWFWKPPSWRSFGLLLSSDVRYTDLTPYPSAAHLHGSADGARLHRSAVAPSRRPRVRRGSGMFRHRGGGWPWAFGRLGTHRVSDLFGHHPQDDPASRGPARRLATLPSDPAAAAGYRSHADVESGRRGSVSGVVGPDAGCHPHGACLSVPPLSECHGLVGVCHDRTMGG